MAQIQTYTPYKTLLDDDDVFIIADSASANKTTGVKRSTIADFSNIAEFLTVGGTGIKTDTITEKTAAAGVTISGAGIQTDIGSLNATGIWRLGRLFIGASVLDSTQYVEVEISGTIYKLCIAV